MPRRYNFWTEARIRRLRDGIARGENRNVIADALGCSRNAVIGKTRRLGLSVPYTPVTDAAIRARLDRRNALAKLRAQRQKEDPNMTYPVKKPDRPVWRPRPGAIAPVWGVSDGPVDIWHLTETSCRWPLWQRDGDPKFYCGEASPVGRPYCLTHTKIADGRRSS